MRIPLTIIDKTGDDLEVRVNASCRTGMPHVGVIQITFIVDTGSSRTTLSYLEAKKYGIPKSRLTPKQQTNIGGTRFRLHAFEESATIAFLDEDNKLQRFGLKPFCTEYPVFDGKRGGRKDEYAAESIPSLLGLDFLAQNGLTLNVNMHARKAYIEKA